MGERIYREGILSSGKSIQAIIKGDISIPGTSFACISCHLRSGIGSNEGGVFTPPVNGSRLFQPLKMKYKGVEVPSVILRPAFTDQSLAITLRQGFDPTGKLLNSAMPRFLLGDDDMALLISYLKTLSAQFSPGVTDTTLKFASVITDDVQPELYEAMLAPLEQYVNHKNSMVGLFKNNIKSARMAAGMLNSPDLAFKKFTLSRWMLTGPPKTWRSQLEEYYRKEPVFALLGGISHGNWKPIHDFSEAHQIPTLFPQTDFPVISYTGWYTLYLSKGYYQEGEGAARYLNSKDYGTAKGKILQIVNASPEAEALSDGFRETWQDLGHATPQTITFKVGEKISNDSLRQIVRKEQPKAILLWDGPDALPILELLSNEKDRPETIILSGGQLRSSVRLIPDQSRGFTYLTYPFRLPKDEERFKGYIEPFKNDAKPDQVIDPILKKSYITTQILALTLMDMRGNYYRDSIFDVIGMMADQVLPLYERIGFGTGQRYASKGCYIVQLDKGPTGDFIKKSGWVLQ